MVELAVGILSQEPKEGIAPAREWAVDVINGFSSVPISDGARKALLENKIDLRQEVVDAAKAYINNCENDPGAFGCPQSVKDQNPN